MTGERGWGGECASAVTLQRPQKPHKTQQSCWVSYWHLGRVAGEEETERSKGLWSKPGALWLESSPVPTKRVGFGGFSRFCNTVMFQMAEARCGTSSNIWGGRSCSARLPARIIPAPGTLRALGKPGSPPTAAPPPLRGEITQDCCGAPVCNSAVSERNRTELRR